MIAFRNLHDVRLNIVPFRLLSEKAILPLCLSIIDLELINPKPIPPLEPFVEKNGSKIRLPISGSIPGKLLRTRISN